MCLLKQLKIFKAHTQIKVKSQKKSIVTKINKYIILYKLIVQIYTVKTNLNDKKKGFNKKNCM